MLELYFKNQKQTRKSSTFVSQKENSKNFEISENLHFEKSNNPENSTSFKIHKRQKQKLSEFTKRPTKLKNTELPINFESPKNLNKFQSTINTNFQNPNSKYSEVERKRVPKKL